MSDLDCVPLNMAELIDEVGDDLVSVVFEAFLEDMVGKMDLLEQTIVEQNPESMRKQAHRIKGCLISIRAGHAAELAKKLEDISQSDDLKSARSVFSEFQAEYGKLEEFVRDFMMKCSPA